MQEQIRKGSSVIKGKTILFVQQGAGISGSGESLRQMVTGLKGRGFSCAVFLGGDGPLCTMIRASDISCSFGPLASLGHNVSSPLQVTALIRFLLTLPACIKTFTTHLHRLEPDIVYLNTSVLLGPALAARVAQIPVVWHVREALGTQGLLSQFMQTMIQRLSTCVITNSDYVAKEFRKPPRPYHVYNAVDLERFDPSSVKAHAIRGSFELAPSNPLIGMISVISSIKGHFVLLAAVPRILKEFPDTRFLIVGGSSLPPGYHNTKRGRVRRWLGQEYDPEAKLHAMVREAGLENNFIFTGFRTDVPEVLADLDVLVFPSTVPEGFGRPLIEAGAMEIPVVASRLGPHPEIVLDGKTGILVHPNDPNDLAEGILTLLRNPPYARQLGQAARSRVRAYFSVEQYISSIENIINNLI